MDFIYFFLCKQQARQSFCSVLLASPIILHSKNQSAAGNVTQLNKKKKRSYGSELI